MPYFDPDRFRLALEAGDREAVAAACLELTRRVVRSRRGELPPGLDPDDVVSVAVVELLGKLTRLEARRSPRAWFNYLTGSVVNQIRHLSKHQRLLNRRTRRLPDNFECEV